MPEFQWCERSDVDPRRPKAINNFGCVTNVAIIMLTTRFNAFKQPARGHRRVAANVVSCSAFGRVHASSHAFHCT